MGLYCVVIIHKKKSFELTAREYLDDLNENKTRHVHMYVRK